MDINVNGREKGGIWEMMQESLKMDKSPIFAENQPEIEGKSPEIEEAGSIYSEKIQEAMQEIAQDIAQKAAEMPGQAQEIGRIARKAVKDAEKQADKYEK